MQSDVAVFLHVNMRLDIFILLVVKYFPECVVQCLEREILSSQLDIAFPAARVDKIVRNIFNNDFIQKEKRYLCNTGKCRRKSRDEALHKEARYISCKRSHTRMFASLWKEYSLNIKDNLHHLN